MIGLLYLLLSFTVGYTICIYAFPGLSKVTETAYDKRKISISPYLLLLPAWYVTGTLAMTWATYLTAFLFAKANQPLFYANLIVMPIAFFVSAFFLYREIRHKKKQACVLLGNDKKIVRIEILILAAITTLACVLMWTTFFVKGDKLFIGVSVFSDFSPHVGMIRSFSYGNNFPTAYPHFAGEDIKYHFMFQFLVGNLEYLGLRIDYAFNIPSILSFVASFLLLYLLTLKITGKLGAGILACLFFAFRSSKALFTFLLGLPKGSNWFLALDNNTGFIGDTPHEDWGLWNLNVYCNQRHLAFGLATIFLVIILLLPCLYEMFEEIKQLNFNKKKNQKKNYHIKFLKELEQKITVLFFIKEGWLVRDLRLSIATGILLGSLSFFHGAAVIGCLTVLFVMAVLSKRRLEYVIVAVITIAMSFLQTNFFIDGSAVSTKFLFGFIAERKTLLGVASYLEQLLGILPFVLLAAFCLEKGVGRYLILAFTAPLVFAFCVSLTIDVTVNHKYIMMSCILLGIFVASLIMKMLERKDLLLRLIGVAFIVMLTATGIYDFVTVLKKSAIVLDLEDPFTKWIEENSDSKDIFLTSNYTINQVVLAGAMLYEGYQYYPWSAGYNTDERTAQVKKMYGAQSSSELDLRIKENNIRFIIVDHDVRSEDYIVNEENIHATYQCVYQEGEGERKTLVYDTTKPLN